MQEGSKGRWRKVRRGVAITLIAAVGWAFTSPIRENYFEISKQLEILNALFRELNIHYVDEIQPGAVMESGIEAMLESLDPYTIYYPESRIEDLRYMTTGEYGGIGATIFELNGALTVTDMLPGYPAERNGLRIGDVITFVDGRDIRGLEEGAALDLLDGATGSTLTLRVERFGQTSPLDLIFVREKIEVPAVPYFGAVADSIGYIAFSQFTRGGAAEVRLAYKQLKDSLDIKALVLDLRGNGGGLLQEAIALVNLFIGEDMPVVSTHGKDPSRDQHYKTMGAAFAGDLPLAVLIDGQSASASEIVAGTLQDYDRAVVVGQQSFGKGLVQQTKDLAYGTRLKVTVSKYYTPSGRCIQRLDYGAGDSHGQAIPDSLIKTFTTANGRTVRDGQGIDPDVEVPLDEMSYVHMGLLDRGVIFDFGTQWVAQHDTLVLDGWHFSESDWQAFVAFAAARPTPYESQTLQRFEALESQAREERVFEADSAAFAALKALVQPDVRRDLERFKDELVQSIEHELVSRMHSMDRYYAWSQKSDRELKKAIELLQSGASVGILAGPGK
jgi:carboxyl-terminal processing protease